MRRWLPVFLVGLCGSILGAILGFGLGWWSVEQRPWPGYPLLAEAQPADVAGTLPPQWVSQKKTGEAEPRVEVPEDTYDFGKIESNSVVRHEFEIRNAGTAPLHLTKGDSSCRCTVLNFEEAELAPGQSLKITLEFDGKDYVGPVTQRATIFTNDLRRPQITFTIKADVVRSIRVVPHEIVFTRLVRTQPAVGEAKIYVFRSQPVQVFQPEFAYQDESRQFFDLQLTPLQADELAVEPGAKAGYRLVVRVKPGLPLGPFQQKIRLHTDQKDAPEIEIPLQGRVESDVSIVGAGWDASRGILHVGRVERPKGAERRVMLRLAALPDQKLEFHIEKSVPEFLQAVVEQDRIVQKDVTLLVPIVIRVPPGAGPANYYGNEEPELGRVIIKTNHPDAPEVKILVRFAVE